MAYIFPFCQKKLIFLHVPKIFYALPINLHPYVYATIQKCRMKITLYLDSSPSCINCPTTRAPCPPTHHGRAPCPSAQPPSLGPDFTRLGARPKTGRVDPRDRLSPVVGPGHTREHSRLSPVVGPAPGHTREHSEHSGNNTIN